MNQKHFKPQTHLIIAALLALTVLAAFILMAGCTLRFEAEKLKLDADPIEGKIGSIEKINTAYKLVALDILKDARPENK